MVLPHDFGTFFFWAFCAVMTFLTGVFAFIAHSVRDDFKEMCRSLQQLTINLASLTARLESLDSRLEKLESTRDD